MSITNENPETMTKNLGLFHCGGQYDFYTISEGTFSNDPDYTLAAPRIDVTFTLFPKEQLIADEVNSIDKKIDKIKDAAIESINRLMQKRSELLALEFQPTTPNDFLAGQPGESDFETRDYIDDGIPF